MRKIKFLLICLCSTPILFNDSVHAESFDSKKSPAIVTNSVQAVHFQGGCGCGGGKKNHRHSLPAADN